MKNYLVNTALTLIISVSLHSQNFISENKLWNVKLTSGNDIFTDILKIQGDTMINSTAYHILWISHDSLQNWFIMGFLREADKVVHFKSPYANEGVLYDFNLNTGETAFVKNYFCGDALIPITVIDVDTVEYSGIARKRWHLGNNGQTEQYWVEGIGSLFGPVHTSYGFCVSNLSWNLLCFHENDTLRYIMPGEDNCYLTTVGIPQIPQTPSLQVFPNPVRQGQVLEIKTPSDPTHIQVVDIFGSVRISKTIDQACQNQGIYHLHIPAGFKPGLYLLRITTHNGAMVTTKILMN